MNIVQLQYKLRDLPLSEVQAAANGQNPEIPEMLATMELNRRERVAKASAQPPTKSIKEQLEERLSSQPQEQMGLQGLGALLGAGTQQQQTEQQALDAQRAQFEQQRLFPYQQLQFMQSFLQGLPVGTQTTSAQLSPLQQAAGTASGLTGIYDTLSKLPGFGG